MSDVTKILSHIESGNPSAAEQLLPLVYDELRKLAAARLAQEKPGQTLQATALVHEAYLRLLDVRQVDWQDRAHFLALSAQMMRRVDCATCANCFSMTECESGHTPSPCGKSASHTRLSTGMSPSERSAK